MQPARFQIVLSTLLALPLVAAAQSSSYSSDPFRDLPPTSPRQDDASKLRLAFVLEAEISLPGPLAEGTPRLRDGGVEVPVPGGALFTTLGPDAKPRRIVRTGGGPAEPDPYAWVEDERGRNRYRVSPDGRVEAQRRCRRCRSREWKRRWSLRVAGNTLSPPVVADGRVWFGALDNRVYCVKARNGHRLWAANIDGRVSSRLVRWTGGAPPVNGSEFLATSRGLILVVPDGGSRMIALDGRSGREVATVRLRDGDGKLLDGPLVTDDGRVIVARQAYDEARASLRVYRLEDMGPGSAGDDAPPPEPAPADAEPAAAEARRSFTSADDSAP